MTEAMNMTVGKFKEKLEKSANQTAKKKTDDSAQTIKELKKLQKQVKEMNEPQMAQRAKSDSDATEDSGWGSDNDANGSNRCELIPQVNELLAVEKNLDHGEGEDPSRCEAPGVVGSRTSPAHVAFS